MDLKKLYCDVTALCGFELPIFKFLAFCDMGARDIIGRFPKKFTVGSGEYITPETLGSSIALTDAFYLAMLYFVLGSARGDSDFLQKSKEAADDAYLSLWKADAVGKRIIKDRW